MHGLLVELCELDRPAVGLPIFVPHEGACDLTKSGCSIQMDIHVYRTSEAWYREGKTPTCPCFS